MSSLIYEIQTFAKEQAFSWVIVGLVLALLLNVSGVML